MKADLATLVGLLDKDCNRALERASEFCIKRGHFEVSLEHYLLQLLDNPTADTNRLLRQFNVDPVEWIKILLKQLDTFATGNKGHPVFSTLLLHWFEAASTLHLARSSQAEITCSGLLETLSENPLEFGAQNLPGIARLKGSNLIDLFDPGLARQESTEIDITEIELEDGDASAEDTTTFEAGEDETMIIEANFVDPEDVENRFTSTPDQLEIPGYQIIKKIGQGGMANVYLASHIGLEREVALKVLSPGFSDDETLGQRFLSEARIVAKLAHPHIIQIYDVNQVNNHHYLAMEYVPAGELTDRLGSELALTQIIKITKQVLGALASAHNNGYIHRDIKPANILFRKNDSAVLTDFGIARAMDVDSGMTIAGSLVGTPGYMSPEQARGEKLDHRSDLYSVGVLFFHMLEGKVPFKGDTPMGTAMRHITDPVPFLDSQHISMQPFIDKALAKDADERFQTGEEMIIALNELDCTHSTSDEDYFV